VHRRREAQREICEREIRQEQEAEAHGHAHQSA
jgi:hypothetical protein